MSSNTSIYMDQNLNGVEVKLPNILKEIKVELNNIIKDSYDFNNIKDQERMVHIPLIRNAALVRNFLYEPIVFEEYAGQNFTASFSVFTSKEEVSGFPQNNFKNKNENTTINHQSRILRIMTDNNHDAKNNIGEKDVSDKNNFISISFGDDLVGQKLMKRLATHLNKTFKTDTYYQKTSLSDNFEKISNKTRKINKNTI
jgi:hypothetical protein